MCVALAVKGNGSTGNVWGGPGVHKVHVLHGFPEIMW